MVMLHVSVRIRLDMLQGMNFLATGMKDVPAQLEVQPKIFRNTKVFCQAQSSSWGDATSLVNHLIDSLVWYMKCLGKLTLTDLHGPKKFFQQHFSRMGGNSITRYAYHNNTFFSNIQTNDSR